VNLQAFFFRQRTSACHPVTPCPLAVTSENQRQLPIRILFEYPTKPTTTRKMPQDRPMVGGFAAAAYEAAKADHIARQKKLAAQKEAAAKQQAAAAAGGAGGVAKAKPQAAK
jgi:hypothetical protein